MIFANVSFDLDGTLIVQDYRRKIGDLARLAEAHGYTGVSLELFRRAIKRANDWYDSNIEQFFQVPEAAWLTYSDILAQECRFGHSVLVNAFSRYFLQYDESAENFLVCPGAIRLIEALLQNQASLFVISGDLMARRRLELVGLEHFFQLVLSPACGLQKPALFGRLLEFRPSCVGQLVHIGNDIRSDLEIPSGLGIRTLLVGDPKLFSRRHSREPAELLAALNRSYASLTGQISAHHNVTS
jgi:FMN phosphatase YigB (HAD superfamily)